MRMSGGWRRSAERSLAGVSPERTPTVGVCSVSPRRSAAARMPAMGARRFFSTSTARALIGERYRTRVRSVFSGTGSVTRRSMAQRNAARVLPEPVGARTRVWSPAAMAGQPLAWASVGAPNVVSNHSRTAGEKGPSVSAATGARYPRGVTVTPGFSAVGAGQDRAMTDRIAFLRAVNLGRRTVPMDRLRSLVAETFGVDDVRTYVNSGNVVFAATGSRA